MAAPFSSGTGDPGEERLAEAARLLVARRGDPVRIKEVDGDLSDPDRRLEADGGLLPGPHATLAGPTFQDWLAGTLNSSDSSSPTTKEHT